MKGVKFSDHALIRMHQRGTTEEEVKLTIREGKRKPAKKGRTRFEHSTAFNRLWGGKRYAMKKVAAIVVETNESLMVVTVYTFYY